MNEKVKHFIHHYRMVILLSAIILVVLGLMLGAYLGVRNYVGGQFDKACQLTGAICRVGDEPVDKMLDKLEERYQKASAQANYCEKISFLLSKQDQEDLVLVKGYLKEFPISEIRARYQMCNTLDGALRNYIEQTDKMVGNHGATLTDDNYMELYEPLQANTSARVQCTNALATLIGVQPEDLKLAEDAGVTVMTWYLNDFQQGTFDLAHASGLKTKYTKAKEASKTGFLSDLTKQKKVLSAEDVKTYCTENKMSFFAEGLDPAIYGVYIQEVATTTITEMGLEDILPLK